MKYINIKDIQKDTFDELETKLPVLPPGLGYFRCINPHMLLSWKNKFISMFGNKGILYLDSIGSEPVEGNIEYVKTLNSINHETI